MDSHTKNNRDERAVAHTANGLYKPMIKAVNNMNLLRNEGQMELPLKESMEALGLYRKEGLKQNINNVNEAAKAVGQPTVEQIQQQRRIMFQCDDIKNKNSTACQFFN